MIIPEKTYTNNPFVDNVIYYAKYLAMNCTVKFLKNIFRYQAI